jgi:hypothetical protein
MCIAAREDPMENILENVEDMDEIHDAIIPPTLVLGTGTTTLTFLTNTNFYVNEAARRLENLMQALHVIPDGDPAFREMRDEGKRHARLMRGFIIALAGQEMLDSFDLWVSITYPNLGAISLDE